MLLLGSKHIYAIAYHPIADGLIERLHRQLKASFMSHHNPIHRIDALPMVLLGIHTTLKDEIHCSATELVYGTTLRLPGEFCDHIKGDVTTEPAGYNVHLKSTMQKRQAAPVRKRPHCKVHVSDDSVILHTSSSDVMLSVNHYSA